MTAAEMKLKGLLGLTRWKMRKAENDGQDDYLTACEVIDMTWHLRRALEELFVERLRAAAAEMAEP